MAHETTLSTPPPQGSALLKDTSLIFGAILTKKEPLEFGLRVLAVMDFEYLPSTALRQARRYVHMFKDIDGLWVVVADPTPETTARFGRLDYSEARKVKGKCVRDVATMIHKTNGGS